MNAQQARRSVAEADCDMADAVLFAEQAIEGRGYLDERERNLARCFKSLHSRARTLAEALRVFGEHHPLCASRDTLPLPKSLCDCGLDAALAALPSVAEQPEDKET